MKTSSRDTLAVGASASLTTTITDADVRRFADATGDTNPIHLDPQAGAESIFGRRVAHGMLSASLISRVLATQLPGPGTIYLSQSLNFRRPVGIGDTLTVRVTVREFSSRGTSCVLDTSVHNQNAELVLDGEARVKLP